MNLSPNFSLDELTASQTATRQGIDNTPSPAVRANLVRVANMLEQVRALVDAPIRVSSGYRSPALNQAIGGASNSAHVLGLAADITAAGISPKQLAIAIRDAGLDFDQVIWEGTWVHLGLSVGKARKQVLTATFTGGRARYSEGIA